LLPFTGVATLAYLPQPGSRIVGLSKLARLVQEYAARPQVQERLADQVVTALMEELEPRGAACAVRGVHSCMALRGARTGLSAGMTTIQYGGDLRGDPWRSEFNSALTTPPWRG
jgi:GTP cyclohydrolase I